MNPQEVYSRNYLPPPELPPGILAALRAFAVAHEWHDWEVQSTWHFQGDIAFNVFAKFSPAYRVAYCEELIRDGLLDPNKPQDAEFLEVLKEGYGSTATMLAKLSTGEVVPFPLT